MINTILNLTTWKDIDRVELLGTSLGRNGTAFYQEKHIKFNVCFQPSGEILRFEEI
jgi:hypothetical protein